MPARVPLRSVTVLLALACWLATAPAATARPGADAWVPVADGAPITVTGGGYGHGHGMSQYGALGAALAGLRYPQILAFYYPGTTLTAQQSSLRVLISADADRDVIVRAGPGLRVADRGRKRAFPLPVRAPNGAGIRLWRLKSVGGRTKVSYRAGGGWKAYRVGGRASLVGNGVLRSASKRLTLRVGGADRVYRGRILLSGTDTINLVGMNAYLRSVVPAEMPASWSAEAVRAQAVAARTYAMWSRSQRPSARWHICDTSACQVYGGVAREHPAATAAIRATNGQILTYGGAPAFTQFSASSGGWTARGSRPYLAAQADPYDATPANTVHTWSKVIDPGVLQRAYPALGTLVRLRVSARDGNGEWGGRVTALTLGGTASEVTISGDRARSLLGLRSTLFTLD